MTAALHQTCPLSVLTTSHCLLQLYMHVSGDSTSKESFLRQYCPQFISFSESKLNLQKSLIVSHTKMQSSRQSFDEDLLQRIKEKRHEKEDDVTSWRRKVGSVTSEGSDSKEEEEVEDDDEEGEPSRRQVRHGYHLVEGKMLHAMEDYIVAENRKEKGHELGLYAIFDGHSGCKVAEYLQSHLFDNILSEVDFWSHPESTIKKAFKKTDDEILVGVVHSRGGSTAVAAILIDRQKLIVANVGDSRAVLSRNGEAEAITVDHEPEKEEEKELVKSKGGSVITKPGNIPRVDGMLAMTRAFGDEKVKEHITAEPDIFVKTIDSTTNFILLASDGLWKVMSNQDAVDYIANVEDPTEASKELIKEALARNSADDISCVVVKFQ